jgi:hypothetical protein
MSKELECRISNIENNQENLRAVLQQVVGFITETNSLEFMRFLTGNDIDINRFNLLLEDRPGGGRIRFDSAVGHWKK